MLFDAVNVTMKHWQVEWTNERIMDTSVESSSTYQSYYIGRLPAALDHMMLAKDEQSELENLLRDSYHCFPVCMNDSTSQDSVETLFEAYCKQTLWPVFHNVVDLYSPLQVITEQEAPEHKGMGQSSIQSFWTPSSQQSTWQAYVNMNQRFAQVIIAIYDSIVDISTNEQSHSKHNIIWIQDYELCLLPSHLMRKKKHRRIKMGMFFHVPFPSSEVFRTLSTRKKLLAGILNADHVGFHFFEYVIILYYKTCRQFSQYINSCKIFTTFSLMLQALTESIVQSAGQGTIWDRICRTSDLSHLLSYGNFNRSYRHRLTKRRGTESRDLTSTTAFRMQNHRWL